ncbi:MAG: PLP-dependent cysteine synthase family protein [Firmicutes bacterium]|nr:PLP-dependent cysteine synthase family protein [Bacillota bacterium]
MQEKFKALEKLIGNTPLLEIIYRYRGKQRKVYAKAEYYNYTGSIKDRMALNILKNAYARGDLTAGDVICETTSGNTGISLCALGTFLGHKVVIFMPDWLSEERKKIMRLYGGELCLVSKHQGGFKGCLCMADEFAKGGGVYLPLQFDNHDNTESHYLTTAVEIEKQMAQFGQKINAIVAGVGTGGTIMGLHKYFAGRGIGIHPLEPAESPTLSTGYKTGSHRIQGISDEFIPSIVDLSRLDVVVGVSDGDSILMAQKLSKVLGLGVGVSSGANFLGALKLQNELGDNANVVTIFADDSKKYLSSFGSEEPLRDGYLSPEVELVAMAVARG